MDRTAATRVASMNLALALGQLSRALFIDASGGVVPSEQPPGAPCDPCGPGAAPEYWPSGMIYRQSLPRLMLSDPEQRWVDIEAAREQFDWVVVDAGGDCDITQLLGRAFPKSARVAVVSAPGDSGVAAAWAACQSALTDLRQLDCVVIVN